MAESQPDASEVFDVEKIRQLIELMKEHDLSEIDLRHEEQQIRLARGGTPVVMSQPVAAAPVAPPAAPAPAAAAPAGDPPPADDNFATINSPMVGTFYSKPNPNAESYVKIGDHVEAETTVCIVEAMKVFNEIPAEVRGRIVAVLVDDGEPVEFGKPLFKIDTSN